MFMSPPNYIRRHSDLSELDEMYLGCTLYLYTVLHHLCIFYFFIFLYSSSLRETLQLGGIWNRPYPFFFHLCTSCPALITISVPLGSAFPISPYCCSSLPAPEGLQRAGSLIFVSLQFYAAMTFVCVLHPGLFCMSHFLAFNIFTFSLLHLWLAVHVCNLILSSFLSVPTWAFFIFACQILFVGQFWLFWPWLLESSL